MVDLIISSKSVHFITLVKFNCNSRDINAISQPPLFALLIFVTYEFKSCFGKI